MERFVQDLQNPYILVRDMYEHGTNKSLESAYIPINDEELCCLIRGKGCALVTNISKLAEQGKIATTKLVTLSNGKTVVLKIVKTKPFVLFRPVNPAHSDHPCVGHMNRVASLGFDIFTNEAIITYMLEKIFMEAKLPSLSVRQLKFGICEDINRKKDKQGIIALEYASFGSVAALAKNASFRGVEFQKGTRKVFTRSTIINIMKQIVTAYDVLSAYDFNHSDAKAANALVFNETISYNYRGMSVISSFTVKIADFDKASISLNSKPNAEAVKIAETLTREEHGFLDGNTKNEKRLDYDLIRIYNRNQIADTYFDLFPYRPTVEKATTTANNKIGEGTYFLDSGKNVDLFAKARHTGLPFYKSFDLYTFIISILLMPEFFYKVFSDAVLMDVIWYPLWVDNQQASIMYSRLKTGILSKKQPSYSNTVSILRKTTLKCGIADEIINKLKTL